MSIEIIEDHVKAEVVKAEDKLKAWFAKVMQQIKGVVPAVAHRNIDNVIVDNPQPAPHVPAPVPIPSAAEETEPTFNGAPAITNVAHEGKTAEEWANLHDIVHADFARVVNDNNLLKNQLAAAQSAPVPPPATQVVLPEPEIPMLPFVPAGSEVTTGPLQPPSPAPAIPQAGEVAQVEASNAGVAANAPLTSAEEAAAQGKPTETQASAV